jgi:carbon-monoxide dehydrogenase medium subunit
MIRTNLRYHRPDAPEQVSELLSEHGDAAAVLGGGTWLLPLMNRGERTHEHVVDLKGLGLEPVVATANGFALAATATYEDVLAHAKLCEAVPLLALMAAGVTGGRQLRNQATLAGSACYQNPSSEVPAVLVALGATMHVHGSAGARDVPAAEFFVDAFRTALADGEFVHSISVPAPSRDAGYVKLKLAAGGWPLATAAAWRDRASRRAVVVLGAVQACPVEIDVTDLLSDGALGDDALRERVAAAVTEPYGDLQADGAYRRRVAAPVALRAARQLVEGAA